MNRLISDIWDSAGASVKEYELPGKTIEGYQVTAELGFSSACRSFLGERISPTTPHERVVIKLWSVAKMLTHKESESLLQELARLQQLKHPYLLPILSTGLYKDVPYSLTEYVASGSLDHLLQRKFLGQPLPEEQALSLIAQLGQTLHYAHQQQIVHGRLKPHNVLLKTSDSVLVTDFQPQTLLSSEKAGLAHPSDLSMYLAPEQLAGKTTPKSDQYALGCLAYEMLTGTKVFMVPSVNTPGKYYKTKALILPRQLNLALSLQTEEAILKALSREPAQRFEDLPAFLTALDLSATTSEEKQQEKRATALTPPKTASPVLSAMQTEASDQLHSMTTMHAIETNNADKEKTVSHPKEVAETQQASKTRGTFPFPPTSQRQSNIRKRVLAVILCLLSFIIGAGALADLLLPHPSPTVSMRASTPTSIPATSVAATPSPSGINIPLHHTPTVQHTVIPTPTSENMLPTPIPPLAPTPTPTPTTTLAQVSLSALFNNRGAGNWPGDADFDGASYSYPAEQLPSGSSITINGVPYQFPTLASGTNDNINAFGQTIPLPSGHYHQAAFLMSSIWGPVTGTLTIQYTDGSSSTTNLAVPDWINDSNKASNVADAWLTSYRYSQSGKNQHISYIYAITVSLDSTRTANALVLPSQLSGFKSTCQLHVFALTVLP
jgi:serine/threonine protein kinase